MNSYGAGADWPTYAAAVYHRFDEFNDLQNG